MDLIKTHLTTHLSSEQEQGLRDLNRVMQDARIRGISLAREDLAEHLDMSVSEVTELQLIARSRFSISLDQPIRQEGGNMHQILGNGNHHGEREQLRIRFTNLLRDFVQRYRRRSGQAIPREILTAEEADIADVAQRFGLSREEVLEQQVEMRRHLRDFLLENGVDESFFD